MRASHIVFGAFALWIALGGSARAACDHMREIIRLTDLSFVQNAQHDLQVLQRLNLIIAELNNDDMLRRLRASGQASQFGDLRNFLTQLRFVTQSVTDNPFRFTEQMQTDLTMSREVVETACNGAAAASAQNSSGGLSPGADTAPEARQLDPAGQTITGNQRPKLTEEQRAFLNKSFQLDLLMRLLGGVAAAILIAALLHQTLLFHKVFRRNRRLCKVPAEIECMMTTLQGHIIILGVYGFRFKITDTLPETMQGLSAGTYCTLHVGRHSIGAKLMREMDQTSSVLFNTPIDKQTAHDILAGSVAPVRFDFSSIHGRPDDPRAFGRGALPPARQG